MERLGLCRKFKGSAVLAAKWRRAHVDISSVSVLSFAFYTLSHDSGGVL